MHTWWHFHININYIIFLLTLSNKFLPIFCSLLLSSSSFSLRPIDYCLIVCSALWDTWCVLDVSHTCWLIVVCVIKLQHVQIVVSKYLKTMQREIWQLKRLSVNCRVNVRWVKRLTTIQENSWKWWKGFMVDLHIG